MRNKLVTGNSSYWFMLAHPSLPIMHLARLLPNIPALCALMLHQTSTWQLQITALIVFSSCPNRKPERQIWLELVLHIGKK